MCRLKRGSEVANERSFTRKRFGSEFVVVIAGPLMNLLFAIIVSIVTLSIFGAFMPSVYENHTGFHPPPSRGTGWRYH
jgi:membrane-associated protease RseP (regulator of RpoE activity)